MIAFIIIAFILYMVVGLWAKKDNEKMYNRFYNEALQENKEKLQKERGERSRGLVR